MTGIPKTLHGELHLQSPAGTRSITVYSDSQFGAPIKFPATSTPPPPRWVAEALSAAACCGEVRDGNLALLMGLLAS